VAEIKRERNKKKIREEKPEKEESDRHKLSGRRMGNLV